MKNNLKIEVVKWIDGYVSLTMIREKVFIEEQKVTPQLEWDGVDEEAIHFLVYKDEKAIGCARAIVIENYMQLGLNQLSSICISAQCHAIDFYKKFGFKVTSDIYLDAEIPHRDMKLEF
jgi:predicted GNAT family N-acyltransferase